MRIAPISMTSVQNTSFKGKKQQQPVVEITDKTPDDTVVAYGSWGSSYIYPITAGQMKKQMAESLIRQAIAEKAAAEAKNSENESPEEYYKRKLYSSEWCM